MAQQTANIMDQFGSDLVLSERDAVKRRKQRAQRGECEGCGRKTHKVSRFTLGRSKREPLTIEGEVVRGICLRCHPLEGYTKRDALKPAIPDTLEVDHDDTMTVASEITMDPYLTSAPAYENPHNSWPVRPPQYGGSVGGRGYSARDRAHHMMFNSRFDPVEEEESPLGRHGQDEVARGRPRISEGNEEDSESEESIELWENHEHLLDHQPQNQQFHPLATHHNLSNSEQSISITEYKEGSDTNFSSSALHQAHREGAGRSHTTAQHSKQKFHPLSRVPQFSASELSEHGTSLNEGDEASHELASLVSTDSDRILRLCHGSRGSLMMEAERSPPRGDSGGGASPMLPPSLQGGASGRGDRRPGSCKVGEARGSWLKRLSHSPTGSGDEGDGGTAVDGSSRSGSDRRRSSSEAAQGEKGGQGLKRDSNRFSLTRLDGAGLAEMGGGGGAEGGGGRFGLKGHKRPTPEGIPLSLQQEMNASKNWDSMDILKDAAAEANGDMLDAEVDALFGFGGVADTIPPRPTNEGGPSMPPAAPIPHRKGAAPPRHTSKEATGDPRTEEGSGLSEGDEVDVMATRLSSAPDEAALASAITQRRRSVESSQEGPSDDGAATNQRSLSSIEDIPVIIRAVRSRPKDEKCTERAFQSLFLLATDADPEGGRAREEILAKGGMETLVAAIWDHMQNSRVLLSLFHALWSISVFMAGDGAPAAKIRECGVLEGLLFAMQSHSDDLAIQDSGCDLITRLTGLLPEDTPEFKSAVTLLSGSVRGIIAGCDAKAYTSCLDALNSLCQLSDENKREFAKAGNECHDAVIRAITGGDGDAAGAALETQELACQLFWCVTSDRAAVSVLSSNCELLLSRKIIDALKSVPRAKSSVHFYGAACGTLANLALEPNNHSKMIDLGVVPVLCEAIYIFEFSADVGAAACTALANLSASREFRKSIVAQGGIPALFAAIKSASDNVNVQSEAFRALHNLCEASSDGKRAIAADVEILVTTFIIHEGEKYIQQIMCSILCRLSSDQVCRMSMITFPGTFDALATIMKSNTKKKLVQKAACSALKNLSLEEVVIPQLISKGFDSLVIDAMDAYGDSEELQECACTFLMNMGSSSPEGSIEICSGGGIRCIVNSMQSIPTSAPLQQASCGALYAITKGDAHKNLAISAGAVDAVIYLMLVHPNEIKVLENAVNVLVNLSSLRKSTDTIANAGGISTVIEVMRSNPTSTSLILSGSRFIQNMSLSRREYADEALGGITPMLGCMDEHPDCAKLVEEACKALRCLVLKSESCRDRLISADGVAVIEKTMEENNASQRWQTLLLDELFQ